MKLIKFNEKSKISQYKRNFRNFWYKKAWYQVSDYYYVLCGTTYIDTICVHPLKSAYNLLKMRTAEKDYVLKLSSVREG